MPSKDNTITSDRDAGTPTSDTPQGDRPEPILATQLHAGAVDTLPHTGAPAQLHPEVLEAIQKGQADREAAAAKEAGIKPEAATFEVTLYAGDPAAPLPDYRGAINGRWFAIQRGVPVRLTESQYVNVLCSGEPVTVYDGYRQYVPPVTVRPLTGRGGGPISQQGAAAAAGLST